MTKKHPHNETKKVELKLSQDEKQLANDIETFEIDEAELKKIKNDFENTVKMLRVVGFIDFIRYMKSPRRIIFANFIGGIFRGLGIIIGMTLIFAVLIWILGQFVNFPLIGEYFGHLKRLLENFNPEALYY